MTRGEFRTEIDLPRPAAAWVMSIVASATLWVTEQLPLWIVGIQCVAFATSFATRRSPPAFRRSPLWLNVGMIGITTVTIRSALDGNPATISLAYFTALAQGLQLLDARPRRTEFVLVALALFQVILASNLTDSVFFPPLVLLFLASVTWTLLVHTLHTEAAEAGDPAAAERALASDLRRMTALATGGCLVVALALFLVLPRMKAHVLRGSMPQGLAVSGFSDRVRLGTVGEIRKDRSVVLRVESLEGDIPDPSQAYWRGLAFDAFDGRDWSISRSERAAPRQPISGVGRFGISLGPTGSGPRSTQRITREPVEAGVLFTAGQVERIQGPFQRLERDPNGGLYVPGQSDERVRYTVHASPSNRDALALRGDRARAPLEPAPGGPRPALRYLALPDLDPRIRARAEQLVTGARSDFERAHRLQQGLRREGRYTDSPPPLGEQDASPIEDFLLGGLEGHCEYFASAMVVLARSLGLPARLVNGFAGGVPNTVGGFVEVTRADAHAWVEVHFEDAGWVRFDPTPPDRRLRSAEALSVWSRLAQLGSAVELWWFQRVVDFDSADQIGFLRGLWRAWSARADSEAAGASTAETSRPDAEGPSRTPGRLAWTIAILAGLAIVAGLASRLAGPRAPDPVPTAYRRALELLERRGLRREPTTSARDFVSRAAGALPSPALEAFARITDRYLANRFGARAVGDLAAELDTLERAVEGMRLGDQPDVG